MEKGEIKGFGIHLKVRNIEISRQFYESLGFKPVFVYGDKKWLNSFGGKIPPHLHRRNTGELLLRSEKRQS
ncbi:MAG: hypothetical protein HYW37_01490 [Candidatus Colwellbacteria bacterium]|nr:hypothetical protein [Candidatus Colwellbacteria bacterium]